MKYQTIFQWSAALAVGLLAVACNSDSTAGPTMAPQTPTFALTVPFNNTGACLALDAFNSGFTNGVNSATTLADPNQHCTSEDVKVAHADLISYSLGDSLHMIDFHPGDRVTCKEGDVVWVHLHSDIHETATSARSDIGMWISMDGGNARTGVCNHYNLVAPPTVGQTLLGVTNIDGDHCGDMNAADSTSVDIGTIATVCHAATAADTALHVGACLGWTQPGGDQACPQGGTETPNGYRYGTVPGTTAKCNCEGFDIPIVVEQTAKLEVKKVCDPTTDNGTFDLLIDGSNAFANNASCGGTTGAQTLSAGTNVNPGAVHTFGEGDFTTSHYSSSYACVDRGTTNSRGSGTSLGPNNITLQPHDDVVCTYTNARIPQLTLVKVVTNDNGGTKTLSDFALTASGPVTISGVSGTTAVNGRLVSAGTYALTEQTQANYTPSSWSCTGGSQSGANITLGPGGTATCTIANNDNGPTLTLVKIITNDNGGTKTLSDFALTASGPLTISGVSGTTAVTTRVVSAGSYALTEQTQTGYTPSSWTCTGGTQSGANIELSLGGSATCTINNNDVAPTLTLVKVVTNNDGGAKTISDFPLTASGPVTISGVSGTTSVTARAVNAGSYALTETTQAGYTPSSWTCSGGTQSGANIVLALGGSATCTIHNDDVGASLTLVKVVTNNNGGTKTLSDFPITASGPVTISGVSGTTDVTGRSVHAGSYALTEQTQTGYTPSSWTCSGGTQTGANIAIGLGGAATCTIANDDIGPTLTLVKTVTNNNGGAKTLSDFPLTATGPVTISGTSGTTGVTARVVSAGSYALTEQTQVGYAASSWTCSGGTQSGANITLPLAGSATCTINNDDISATLTLVKVVTNNNGGTKTLSDFPLFATGPGLVQVVACSGVSGTAGVTGCAVGPGSYALTEQTQAGYAPTLWTCSGGTQSGANIALALGGAATCTIGNDDIGPTLTLVKTVTNDNGGTKTLSDFPLTASGPVTVSGVSGTTSVTARMVNAGSYALTERTQAGYTPSSWTCSGGTQSGANIALAVGGSATCTINNNDNPATLTIIKMVKGAGTTFTFNTTGAGLDPTFTLTPPTDGQTQKVYTGLSVGTRTITEVVPLGYALTDLACSDQGSVVLDPAVTQTVSTTLTLGGSVTCTFTNQLVSQTTRTQGFWATHKSLTNVVWFGGSAGGHTFAGVSDQTLCGRSLNTLPIVLGGFWSNVAMTTAKTKRSSLDQRRMQLLQQLLAAILNNAAFGSTPGGMSIADAKAAYCGTNETAVQIALAAMSAFNESGDGGLFTPGVSANGKQAKDLADLGFWDVLP